MKAEADFLIKNGRVVDPSRGIDRVMDVAVRGSHIVETGGEGAACTHVIDASGCIVAPGLIDFHTHIFYEGSGTGLRPDFMAAQGTTAAVDAGTAGTVNYEAFYKTVVVHSALRLKGFVTVYSGGQLDTRLCEDFDPALYNLDRLERVIDRYRDNILGLKIRISRGIVPNERGLDYLKYVVELAEELNRKLGTDLRVCVHATNPPCTAGELAGCLRPGDIFCHCYHGNGNGIVREDGSIDPGVLAARARGVLFDAANGRSNFDVGTARRAMAAGFLPDIISTDLTVDKFNIPPYVKNLPTLLSKYLSFGMSLEQVLRAVTEVPARAMGLAGKIGTLAPGAWADLVILRLKEQRVVHRDWKGEELAGDVLFVPQLTMCGGEILFSQTDFFL